MSHVKSINNTNNRVCDFVWSLLEPWDKDILAHDEQLHVLLEEFAENIRQGVLGEVAEFDSWVAEKVKMRRWADGED